MSEEELDVQLFEVFLGDARKISKALGDGLLALMENLSDMERITSLVRLAHSLKGAASSVVVAENFPELSPLVEMAGAMEACFNAVKAGRLHIAGRGVGELLEGVGHVSALGELSPAELKDWLLARAPALRELAQRYAKVERGVLPQFDEPLNETPGSSAPREPASPPAPETPAKEPSAVAPERPAPSSSPETLKAPAQEPPQAEPPPKERIEGSLLGLFKTEAETQAQLLSEGLMKLEAEPAAANDTLVALMRVAHSLKGAARIIQLDDIVALAHAMEDCFVAAMEGKATLDEDVFDLLLEGSDIIAAIPPLEEAQIAPFVASRKQRVMELVEAYKSIKGEGAAAGVKAPAPASGAKAPAPASSASPAPEPAPVSAPVPAQEPPPAPRQDSPSLRANEASAPQGASQPAPPAGSVPPASAKPPEDASGKGSFVRVGADKLNRLLALAGESIVDAKKMRSLEGRILSLKSKFVELSAGSGCGSPQLSKQASDEIFSDISSFYTALSDFLLKMDNFSSSLYNEVFDCRIRPFEDGVGGFPRMVRDISKRLGKKVRFEINGRRTDVDRDILEKLEAPLNHILRNALDHGIEPPEERLKLGKPETGTIELSAYHWAGSLNIKVVDDGRGIDIAEVARKVVKKGLASEAMVKGMTDAEILEFLFLPGFSTASSVTEISGRGVGLDVVQSMAQQVRGSVRIETALGKGTAFHLQLPVTLSLIPALLATIDGEAYAFPLVRVERLLRAERGSISSLGGRQFVSCDGDNIGLVSARELLGLPLRDISDQFIPAVVVGDRSCRYAVVVDSFVGEREIVVRPLDERLGKVNCINAASLTDDGSPLLILDVDDLIRSTDSLLKGGALHRLRSSEIRVRTRKKILVADDSLTVRELERNLLANSGYDVDVAIDGAEAWNAVRLGSYDMVVTDVDMPRMNGFELVEKIKASERLKAIPVVIVSYKDREEDRLKGLDVGADYYLTKGSFHDNSFIQAVNDLIGGSSK